MPRILGLHNLFGVLAAVVVGAVLGLLKVNGLVQVLFVLAAYVLGSVVAQNALKKRRATQVEDREPATDKPRFHHFDSRAMDHIEQERRKSGRRETQTDGEDPLSGPRGGGVPGD